MNENYLAFLDQKQKAHVLSGFELKKSYFDLAKSNIKSAVIEKSQIQIF